MFFNTKEVKRRELAKIEKQSILKSSFIYMFNTLINTESKDINTLALELNTLKRMFETFEALEDKNVSINDENLGYINVKKSACGKLTLENTPNTLL